MKSIMLATDGSPSAEDATQEAIELASELHVPLTVVSVAHAELPFTGYYGYATTDVIAELCKIEREHVEAVLAAVRERANRHHAEHQRQCQRRWQEAGAGQGRRLAAAACRRPQWARHRPA